MPQGQEGGFASETPGPARNQVAAREVGDSLFIIRDSNRFGYRTLILIF